MYFCYKKYNKSMEVLCIDCIRTKETNENCVIISKIVVYYYSAGIYKTNKIKEDESK
ncbi:hypothetical protein JSCD14_01130 [Clostridioides difficile]|nr:hypothetical protein [Clostridioides difficile]CCK88933.1 conserved hypothetical protein [Clostridioides difficile T5]CCK92381.1 conserved hypothetical protein [Clostridioides difficile T20]CCK96081.1 conserved hypothetical protein [Clostridioides difficile E1]CCL00030.1 conserved hypothetical protein [Clostridioides difficile E10]MBH8118738.1 hypothetical protein [Clostridioides difficile]